MDDRDRALLSALRENGREPVASLARRLDVSRARMNSRLERLLTSGTVVGFSVRVRDELDPPTIRAVSLLAVEGSDTDRVISELKGLPEIRAVHTTNGGWDLAAEPGTQTLTDFGLVLGKIRSIPGIVNSETSLLLSSVLR
ncbi:Lrp/AsnC family transcriptional regulator [Arthrobacter sp. AQ5-05]|uniref:Lrp/AsnC family transcriptional regulator n=1 Tax=Arthrobacter sp. AQ5-05 TaxID=2184581 RepID=UPI001E54D1B6|nr:Lrp/AsnC family transcriptional regulator [Arthrobacter sp. AQ5-05]